ncbi:MAG: cupin domain-containing protein, partial [Vicinamibacterales bacterium]
AERVARRIDPQRVETIEVLGPTIQFLTSPEASEPCIMRGTIPAGVSVPLHSHADPETFLMMSGTVEGLIHREEDFEWVRIKPGDIFHVPGHAKHAWRNHSHDPATMIIVSTSRMGQFFQELGKPATPGMPAAPPAPEEIQRFLRTAERYGHWTATPEENAKVGLEVPA